MPRSFAQPDYPGPDYPQPDYPVPDYLSPSRPHMRAVRDRWPPGLALAVILALSCGAWLGVAQLVRVVVLLAE